MNRLNINSNNGCAWPFSLAPNYQAQNTSNQQIQLLLLQQKNYLNSLSQSNFDFNASVLQQQNLLNNFAHSNVSASSISSVSSSNSSSSTSSPTNHFSSSFSVNSLLNNHANPNSSLSPLPVTPDKTTSLNQQAAAVLTQHLASVMINYRLFQQQQQQQRLYSLNDSAFQQPAMSNKRSKHTDSNYNSQEIAGSLGNNGLNISQCSILSPGSASSSSSLDFHVTNECNFENTNPIAHFNNNKMQHSNNSDDSKQHKSSNRKRLLIDQQQQQHLSTCPICGISLNLDELQSHFDYELEKLNSASSTSETSGSIVSHHRKRTLSEIDNDNEKILTSQFDNQNAKYLAYIKIKENRQERLKNKLRFTRMKENNFSTSDCVQTIVMCPLCNQDISDLKERINIHLEECFTSSKFLEQQNGDLFSRFKRKQQNFEQNDYDDENAAENRLKKRMRTNANLHNSTELEEETVAETTTTTTSINSTNTSLDNDNHDLNKDKCVNCRETNRDSFLSVTCWHVFCAKCWLRTNSEEKFLCPQCNMITQAKDLRRIFK